MFPIYPGFEDLSLRVEVQWRERKRTVVARLEQWPGSDKAVVVCAFEGDKDEREWLISANRNIYVAKRPDKWIKTVVSGQGVEERRRGEFHSSDEENIRDLIRRSFTDDSIVRVFYLPTLPAFPRVVLQIGHVWCWCLNTTDETQFLFRINTSKHNRTKTIEAQLQRVWDDETSDMRFVWKWFGASDDELYRKLTGFTGTWTEVEAIMKNILISATPLWQLESRASWSVGDTFDDNFIKCKAGRLEIVEQQLQPWVNFLQSYFLPLYRAGMKDKHLCMSPEDIESFLRGLVGVGSPPTAHEQIEAKLALRDWLKDKATPAVAASLLASLES